MTRYADTAVGRIAYQVVGDGDPDLLVLHPLVLPVDLMWDEPTLVRFLERLASFTCSIWFDPRGRGASDPLPHEEGRFAESVTDDELALLDFLGCERVSVLGLGPRRPCSRPPTPNARERSSSSAPGAAV